MTCRQKASDAHHAKEKVQVHSYKDKHQLQSNRPHDHTEEEAAPKKPSVAKLSADRVSHQSPVATTPLRHEMGLVGWLPRAKRLDIYLRRTFVLFLLS
jgi:hypothetical protein